MDNAKVVFCCRSETEARETFAPEAREQGGNKILFRSYIGIKLDIFINHINLHFQQNVIKIIKIVI